VNDLRAVLHHLHGFFKVLFCHGILNHGKPSFHHLLGNHIFLHHLTNLLRFNKNAGPLDYLESKQNRHLRYRYWVASKSLVVVVSKVFVDHRWSHMYDRAVECVSINNQACLGNPDRQYDDDDY